MTRKDDSPRSITPAIIHVRIPSEPLSPERQEQVHQQLREIKQRRQYYVDIIRHASLL